ncbi:MAG: UvrB/UvrC motif-containing protein, partial [Dethiobacteria bacterium]
DVFLRKLEKEMKKAARELDFEHAAELRDLVFEIRAMNRGV